MSATSALSSTTSTVPAPCAASGTTEVSRNCGGVSKLRGRNMVMAVPRRGALVMVAAPPD